MNQFNHQKLSSFFITDPAPCPYIDGQMERKLFTHLTGSKAVHINNTLTHAGFRRSQTVAYRPACDACTACASVRVRVGAFTPSRNLKRIYKRNEDLTRTICPPSATREQYDLFVSYLDTRHPAGGMSGMTPLDFMAMIEETTVDTHLVEYRLPDNRLVACVLADKMADGLSLVYSFFDTKLSERSLGTLIILDQIKRAQLNKKDHVYLGYFIHDCEKMSYKQRFKPLDVLHLEGWVDFDTHTASSTHTAIDTQAKGGTKTA